MDLYKCILTDLADAFGKMYLQNDMNDAFGQRYLDQGALNNEPI